MLLRPLLLKLTRNLALIRSIHLAVAMVAGVFLVLHVVTYISYPLTLGVELGYAAFASAAVVWVTGSAFLQRVKDSLFFHGSLTTLLVALILMHAGLATATMPLLWGAALVSGAALVGVTNALYHLAKGFAR